MPASREGFLVPSDTRLYAVAKKIEKNEFGSKELEVIIEKMLLIAYGEQSDRKKPVLVGLAAPQIGIDKRIILVDAGANGKGDVSNLMVFVNPEIIWQSDESAEWYEGCYSTGQVCGIVSRPVTVRICALNEMGDKIEQEYEGYVARIFQHEIDHLNGILFVSRITDPEKLHLVLDGEFPSYRNQEAWRTWTKKVTFEEWQKLQKG